MADSLKHSFVVGETYQDRVGAYTVISVEGNRLVYEYADRIQREGDVVTKWRIHWNILSEKSGLNPGRPSQPFRSKNVNDFFTHAEAFPIIAHVIEMHSRTHQKLMTHDEMVKAVMNDLQEQVILDRRPDKPKSWSAGVKVAQFSKAITGGKSEWDGRFDRDKISGVWAYRVRRGKAKATP